ncbi:DDE-type integrase/transposase/recombinase [Methylocapsa sp. D3K7]|uniref:DDE-type integrase/transposase/recombinase n=1 Tax=Methylocapsa sp. D3K7 TaxID=3041435 RepID=UPI0032969538
MGSRRSVAMTFGITLGHAAHLLCPPHESIRRWALKFGPIVARNLRKIRPKTYTRWHLYEMVVSIAGSQMYMWQAVDSEGEVFEILVQDKEECRVENHERPYRGLSASFVNHSAL